jgi:hypothetical protein
MQIMPDEITNLEINEGSTLEALSPLRVPKLAEVDRPCVEETRTPTLPIPADTPHTSPDFFEGDDTPRAEIVEGLIREGQLVAFAGPYGMGKSPILTGMKAFGL